MEKPAVTFTFDIIHSGERSAGINAYEEEVKVSVKWGFNGCPDTGEEFIDAIVKTLTDFYDGAKVYLSGVSLENISPKSP